MFSKKRMGISGGLVLFALVALLAACSGTKATMVEIDGVLHVMNPAEPLNPGMDVRIVELLRIGQEDGPDEYLLPGVQGLAVDASGNSYALMTQEEAVRVFNVDGVYSHDIGRRGAGPGELMGAMGVNVANDGSIWVPSMQLQRLSVFKPDGEFLRDIRFALIPPLFIQTTEDGFTGIHFGILPTDDPTLIGMKFHLRRFNTDGDTLNTLFTTEIQIDATDIQLGGFIDKFPLYTIDGQGRIWQTRSRTDVYEVNVWNPEGSLDRVVEKEFEKLAKSEEEIEEEREIVRRAMARAGGQTEEVNISYDPDPYRPATGIPYYDPRGFVWVQTSKLEGTDTNIFDLFDMEGSYMRTVEMPGVKSPAFLNFVGGKVYLTDASQDVTPQIIVFSVTIQE